MALQASWLLDGPTGLMAPNGPNGPNGSIWLLMALMAPYGSIWLQMAVPGMAPDGRTWHGLPWYPDFIKVSWFPIESNP